MVSLSTPGRNASPVRGWLQIVDFLAKWAMPVTALLLLEMTVRAVLVAKTWPLVHDAPLMHYVVFLMDHGRAPYRDILEMNMPGAYVTEWLAIHVLGGGAFGWWLWDLLLGVGAVGASAWIAGEGRRSVGVAAGSLAYLSHLSEGPWNMGQRDWVVAVLVLAAFGCMFETIRTERAEWMAGFMGLSGLAASIKPPAIGIGIAFLIAACWLVRRRQRSEGAAGRRGYRWMVFWAFLGALVPLAMDVVFLVHWGVVKEFFASLHGLVAWYAGLERVGGVDLYPKIFVLRQLLVGGLVLFLLTRAWKNWESNFLGVAALAGAGLYLIQGKGFNYHLYTEIAFVALWAFLQVERALERGMVERVLAVVTLAAMIFIPRLLLRREKTNVYPVEAVNSLQSDLTELGGAALSGRIQCLDMTMAGCINVLYRMQLVQSTGYIYDFYLFPPETNEVTRPLQARFLDEISRNRPLVFVLSSHTWPGDFYGYEQLANFPALEQILEREYHIVRERPPHKITAGYRIYELNERPS